MLDGEVLDDGLDDEVAARQVGHGADRRQPPEHRVRLGRVEPAPLDRAAQPGGDPRDGLRPRHPRGRRAAACGDPAVAATCAMPAPMVPAPTTPTTQLGVGRRRHRVSSLVGLARPDYRTSGREGSQRAAAGPRQARPEPVVAPGAGRRRASGRARRRSRAGPVPPPGPVPLGDGVDRAEHEPRDQARVDVAVQVAVGHRLGRERGGAGVQVAPPLQGPLLGGGVAAHPQQQRDVGQVVDEDGHAAPHHALQPVDGGRVERPRPRRAPRTGRRSRG